MKKYTCLVFLAALILSNPSFAQSVNKGKFTFGPVFGIDINTVKGTMDENEEFSTFGNPLLSLNLNLAFQYKLSERFTLAAEPGFIQKGYSNHTNSYDRYMYNYFQLPLLLKVKTVKELSLAAGFEYDRHIVSFQSQGNVFDRMGGPDKNNEFSALLGAEYAFSPDWSVGIRYSHALSPFIEYITFDDYFIYYNRYIQLALFHNW